MRSTASESVLSSGKHLPSLHSSPSTRYAPVSYTHLDVYKRQLERIRIYIGKLEEIGSEKEEVLYGWWNDLNNDFIRLNQNYQDYRCV